MKAWSLQCEFVEDGWGVRMDENAGLYVTANDESAVGQCAGVDAFGAETVEHRNYIRWCARSFECIRRR